MFLIFLFKILSVNHSSKCIYLGFPTVSVFHRSILIGIDCTMFNPFPNKPWFLRVCSTSLLKTLWEKEKLLITSNFSFSHHVFYPFGELSAIFIKSKVVVCKLFLVWKGLELVVWEWVNSVFNINPTILASAP